MKILSSGDVPHFPTSIVGDNDDIVQHADRLRTGTWVPESGRHAERGALDEITAEHRLQRAGTMTYPRERPAAPPWLVDFGPNTAEFEELGRVYRGSRRAGHHPRLLVFGAVLLVAATLGIVISMMPAHHGAQPGGPG